MKAFLADEFLDVSFCKESFQIPLSLSRKKERKKVSETLNEHHREAKNRIKVFT